MIDFLKKYKTQIFNIITIFLILEFAIYPGLTTANTFSNIMAGIGLLLLIVWAGLALYEYARNSDNLGVSKKIKDELQTKAGIKGNVKQTISAEEAKEIANSLKSDFEKSDPLSDIAISRVSKEAKQKMADIAKKDIAEKLQENVAKVQSTEITKPKRKYTKKPKQ